MEELYDLIIVGGGPIGLACGLEARKKQLRFVILEKGCLVNSLYHYPINMTFFSTSERLEIGGIPFVSNNAKPTRPEALEYYRRVALSHALPLHLQEKVLEISPLTGEDRAAASIAATGSATTTASAAAKTVASTAATNEQQPPSTGGSSPLPDYGDSTEYGVITSRASYRCRYIIIATGFYDIPVLMEVPGETLPKVTHYYKDPHFYATHKVMVVGANNSAVDAALETYRKGAEVTLVAQGPGIGERVKYWVRPDIENRIREGSIRAFFHSRLTEIRDKEVDIQTPEGKVTIANDFVIAATGYKPDFDFLRKTGIRLSDDEVLSPQYDPETMETNMPNIFLAGVVCGGMNTHVWFIENSREHATRILQKIAADQERSSHIMAR